MSWFCQTKEATKQLEKCQKNKCTGCSKCVAIEESGWAMLNHGVPAKEKQHPLYSMIK